MSKYAQYLVLAKTIKITKNFTMHEVCYSETAVNNGIDNTPNLQIQLNSRLLIEKTLQPTRDHFGKPLWISCIYRCLKLNKLVGGVDNSQHLKGEACDFVPVGVPIIDVFNWMRKNLIYDQLIFETQVINGKNVQWIHVSYSRVKNRQQAMKSVNGKYKVA